MKYTIVEFDWKEDKPEIVSKDLKYAIDDFVKEYEVSPSMNSFYHADNRIYVLTEKEIDGKAAEKLYIKFLKSKKPKASGDTDDL